MSLSCNKHSSLQEVLMVNAAIAEPRAWVKGEKAGVEDLAEDAFLIGLVKKQ